jgi:hypothetical protein
MIVQFDISIILYGKIPQIICFILCSHMPLHLTQKSLLSRSSMFIDGNGGTYEVDLEDIQTSKADPLGETVITSIFRRFVTIFGMAAHIYLHKSTISFVHPFFSNYVLNLSRVAPFSARLIDGINQNVARRRALMLFCFEFLNANARVRHISRSLNIYKLLCVKCCDEAIIGYVHLNPLCVSMLTCFYPSPSCFMLHLSRIIFINYGNFDGRIIEYRNYFLYVPMRRLAVDDLILCCQDNRTGGCHIKLQCSVCALVSVS